MHFQTYLQVRLLQKLMVVMLLLPLLASGDQTGESMLVGTSHSPGVKEKEPVKKNQQHQQHRRLRHSSDVFFSSQRKVPNSSDPLHNR
ncbi:hypothetical protein V6N13_048073 [Hibiscus sabdariffa]|uniref:Uncharacterized protein n=1 Tax=Hibiscus sabdariffa TaxID=183260 RepID=A0ABR2F633_9ROSI